MNNVIDTVRCAKDILGAASDLGVRRVGLQLTDRLLVLASFVAVEWSRVVCHISNALVWCCSCDWPNNNNNNINNNNNNDNDNDNHDDNDTKIHVPSHVDLRERIQAALRRGISDAWDSWLVDLTESLRR